MSEETKKIEDTKVESSKKDADDNRIYAVLAYLGILCLIPMLAAKKSKFAQFHVNQGLILFVFGVASNLISRIPRVGGTIYFVVSLVILILSIMGIVSAIKGETKKLPIIGNMKMIKY